MVWLALDGRVVLPGCRQSDVIPDPTSLLLSSSFFVFLVPLYRTRKPSSRCSTRRLGCSASGSGSDRCRWCVHGCGGAGGCTGTTGAGVRAGARVQRVQGARRCGRCRRCARCWRCWAGGRAVVWAVAVTLGLLGLSPVPPRPRHGGPPLCYHGGHGRPSVCSSHIEALACKF